MLFGAWTEEREGDVCCFVLEFPESVDVPPCPSPSPPWRVAGEEPGGDGPREARPREPAGLSGDEGRLVLEPRPHRALAPREVSR